MARRLLRGGHEVVVLDNLTTGYAERVPVGAEFIEGSCQDERLYGKIPQHAYDAIYHIAGQSSGEISFDDPVYDLQTNTQSTLLLLQFAQKVGCKRVLYGSTMSVYGDHPDIPISEGMTCAPKSFYGVGKLASEQYLRIYGEYGIHSTAIRLSNVYGPGQNMANLRQGMVSIFLAQAIEHRRVHVKGSKDRFRDFVYVDDVVDALLACEGNDKSFGRIFNVATGVKTTVETLLKEITTNLPFEVEIEFSGSTPGDQFGIYCDIGAIQQSVGWSPQYDLASGVKAMVQWALDDWSPQSR